MNLSGSKKNLNYSIDEKRQMIERNNTVLSIKRQCELLGLSRAAYYYEPEPISDEQQILLNIVDQIYTEHPYFGHRRMLEYLKRMDDPIIVGRKQMRSCYHILGLEAIYPKPKLSLANKEHKIYPYLLKDYTISRPNEVWSSDLTYIRLTTGFVYLAAIIDWYSRYVLDWDLSINLETEFCVETLSRVLYWGKCNIFNTDQGSQFTSKDFVGLLLSHDINISMDGRGRALDNIFIERLWRSIKYECIYIRSLSSVAEARAAIDNYFKFYNNQRPHQALGYKTPAEVYFNDAN
jgi:putative transposase